MKKSLILIFLVFAGFLSGCYAQGQSKGDGKTGTVTPKKITAEQAKAIMDKGEPYTLVDVRTPGEFNDGHIKGALLIPVDEIGSRAEKELPDKNAVILVYCRSGVRAGNAAQTLAGMGYTNINNFGGIISWPYGTVKN